MEIVWASLTTPETFVVLHNSSISNSQAHREQINSQTFEVEIFEFLRWIPWAYVVFFSIALRVEKKLIRKPSLKSEYNMCLFLLRINWCSGKCWSRRRWNSWWFVVNLAWRLLSKMKLISCYNGRIIIFIPLLQNFQPMARVILHRHWWASACEAIFPSATSLRESLNQCIAMLEGQLTTILAWNDCCVFLLLLVPQHASRLF